MSESNYENKYGLLMDELQKMHERNVQKTRRAFRSLLIVPLIFLILLFLVNKAKTVFLVLWILSIFGIGLVLIAIEYQDYNLKKMMEHEPSDTAEAEETVTE